MVHLVLRGLFIVMATAVAGLYAARTFTTSATGFIGTLGVAVAIALLLILADVLTPRKKLSEVSGVFLGLIVGMLAAYALSFLVDFVHTMFPEIGADLVEGIQVFIGVICVFGAISLILQTKDDFRFVIPYVEFTKQIRGTRPMILDSSAIIDGRFLDAAETNIIAGQVLIPRFVINELQTIADASDKLKRTRGRRGLDIVAKLQSDPKIDVSILEADAEGVGVDQKLVSLAAEMNGRLVTTDFNLAKVAEVRGVEVVNINALAEAMRPVVLPGEALRVEIIKPGESASQGVGYLEDGTMVVVENARHRMGQSVDLTVTSTLQTNAGRMIFGKVAEQDRATAGTTAGRPTGTGSDAAGTETPSPATNTSTHDTGNTGRATPKRRSGQRA